MTSWEEALSSPYLALVGMWPPWGVRKDTCEEVCSYCMVPILPMYGDYRVWRYVDTFTLLGVYM